MSNENYWDEDDDDQNEEPDNSGQVSENNLIRKLRRGHNADAKKIKELTEQLESLSKSQNERVVKEILEKKGVNPKAARLVLKDLDEISEENVNTWLEDNAELFVPKTETTLTAEEQADLDALARQDALTQGAGSPGRESDIIQRMEKMSADELRTFLLDQ